MARPAERPIVVFEASVAAVWRMGEGLVGGGVCLREEMLEKGMRGLVVGGLEVGFGMVLEGLAWERAEAADLEVRVEGPFVRGAFFATGLLEGGFVVAGFGASCFNHGCLSRSICSIIVWHFASAALLAGRFILQIPSGHSISQSQGKKVVSRSRAA